MSMGFDCRRVTSRADHVREIYYKQRLRDLRGRKIPEAALRIDLDRHAAGLVALVRSVNGNEAPVPQQRVTFWMRSANITRAAGQNVDVHPRPLAGPKLKVQQRA